MPLLRKTDAREESTHFNGRGAACPGHRRAARANRRAARHARRQAARTRTAGRRILHIFAHRTNAARAHRRSAARRSRAPAAGARGRPAVARRPLPTAFAVFLARLARRAFTPFAAKHAPHWHEACATADQPVPRIAERLALFPPSAVDRHTRGFTDGYSAHLPPKRQLALASRVFPLFRYGLHRLGAVRAARAVHQQGHRDDGRSARLSRRGAGARGGHPARDARQPLPVRRRPAHRADGRTAVRAARRRAAVRARHAVVHAAPRARRVPRDRRRELRGRAADGGQQLSAEGAGPRARPRRRRQHRRGARRLHVPAHRGRARLEVLDGRRAAAARDRGLRALRVGRRPRREIGQRGARVRRVRDHARRSRRARARRARGPVRRGQGRRAAAARDGRAARDRRAARPLSRGARRARHVGHHADLQHQRSAASSACRRT